MKKIEFRVVLNVVLVVFLAGLFILLGVRLAERAFKPSKGEISIGDVGIVRGSEVGYAVWTTKRISKSSGFSFIDVNLRFEGKAASLEEAKEMVNIICARLREDSPSLKIGKSFWRVEESIREIR